MWTAAFECLGRLLPRRTLRATLTALGVGGIDAKTST